MSNRIFIADKETLDRVESKLDKVILEAGWADISSFHDVQAIVRAGLAANYFIIGDEIVSLFDGSPIAWQVIGIDIDTPSDPDYTHSMTLQTKDVLLTAMFDAPEPNNPDSNRKSNGNNRYIHSGQRQWLNSDAASFAWQSQHQYDAAPTGAPYTGPGFLRLLDPEMTAVLGAVSKGVARADVDGGGRDSFSDKVFPLSQYEVNLGTASAGDVSGEFIYPYYQGAANAKRVKLLNGSAQRWWLRSPHVADSYGVRGVITSGAVYYDYASSAHGVAPACCII